MSLLGRVNAWNPIICSWSAFHDINPQKEVNLRNRMITQGDIFDETDLLGRMLPEQAVR